jgi:hypothetical protein
VIGPWVVRAGVFVDAGADCDAESEVDEEPFSEPGVDEEPDSDAEEVPAVAEARNEGSDNWGCCRIRRKKVSLRSCGCVSARCL